MTRASALLALRSATLAGLAAAAALSVDYRSTDASFCGPDSGCAALRETELAYLWGAGITLPEVGLVGLSLAFALSLRRDATWGARLAAAGGAAGLVLLLLQAFALETFCWLCVVTDVSAAVAGAFGVVALRSPRTADDRAPLRPLTWALLAVLAAAAPAFWPRLKPVPPVPEPLRAYYRPGKINVIEFTDFECPFCRRLHGRLKKLLVPYGERVNLVRLNAPLDSHPNAWHAALAAICAEPSGKAEQVSEFLYTSGDLSEAAIRRHAVSLGIDGAAFDRCLASPASNERVTRERRILHDIGFEGLPTTYVGDQRIIGARADAVFSDALERAASGTGERGVPPWAYALLVVAVAAALVRLGWTGRVSSSGPVGPARS